jgi:chemotaxis protein MotB
MQRNFLYLCSLLLIFSSCVTPKIHNALIAENQAQKTALNIEQKKALKLQSEIEELEGDIISLKVKVTDLINDSTQNGGVLIVLQNKFDALVESYDLLASKNSREMANMAKEIKQLLEQFEESQSELFTKEDELTRLSSSLELKEEELILAKENLDSRSTRVVELESIINKKDSIVNALKKSISKALIGLEGEGITIEKRDGKVYISMEEALLFASGKYEVNSGGIDALNKLATALSIQNDLEILVEGHTDSISFSGKGLVKDNWDLSVMRATNVVKVLTKNSKLDPQILTAAGRAEFLPIASNKKSEGRSANRRIEMILSPNLDDLFRLLEE